MRLLVLAILLAAAPARADVTAEASAHFEAGVALAKRANHAAALAEFEKAYALVPAQWELLFNIGVTQRSLFRYGAAIKSFTRYLAAGDKLAADRRQRVEAEIAELRGLVGEVVVHVDGPPARIEIDALYEGETPLEPILVAPGEHTFTASRTGELADARRISVVSGTRVELRLAPQKRDLPVHNHRRAWIVVGASVVVGAIVTGVVLASQPGKADVTLHWP